MIGKYFLYRSAEVNGTKTKSLRCGRIKRLINDKRAKQGKTPLLDSQMVSMGVLSDDFATVDVLEELCYHSLTEKANSRGKRNGKTNYEKAVRGGKSGSRSPKRFSGDGSAPPRFRFGFPCCSCCLFRGVCLAAARVSAPHLSMPSTRHGAK